MAETDAQGGNGNMVFEVGQRVFVVYSGYGGRARTTHAKIEKIGTKWAYLDRLLGRFDINTNRLDGGKYTSLGRVYNTEYDYQAEIILRDAWASFQSEIQSMNITSGLTTTAIEKARKALRITEH